MRTTTTAIALAALALTACGPVRQEHTFLQEAVLEHLKNTTPNPFDKTAFVFTEWEVTDTMTRMEEINRSISTYGKACEAAKRTRDAYRQKGKRRNAQRADSTVNYTAEVAEKLTVMRGLMRESADSVLYYCVRFGGHTLGEKPGITCNTMYATVTPEGRVMKLQNNANHLKRDMGVLLPGYESLLESCRR